MHESRRVELCPFRQATADAERRALRPARTVDRVRARVSSARSLATRAKLAARASLHRPASSTRSSLRCSTRSRTTSSSATGSKAARESRRKLSTSSHRNMFPGNTTVSTPRPARKSLRPMPRSRKSSHPPRCGRGARVKRWAVGVTTAPRAQPTLGDCLTSLASAGWTDSRLFVDGPVDVPEPFLALPRTERTPRIGAWPSYYLALAELLMREPRADAFLLVQDDVVFAPGFDVRSYLEEAFWPGKKPAIVSLLCPRPYTQTEPGWYPLKEDWIWGAQAFVFSPLAARAFLADMSVVCHRDSRDRNPTADIDWCVGQWASRHKQPIFYPTPSLVQHVGQISSLWTGRRAWGRRRASWLAQKRTRMSCTDNSFPRSRVKMPSPTLRVVSGPHSPLRRHGTNEETLVPTLPRGNAVLDAPRRPPAPLPTRPTRKLTRNYSFPRSARERGENASKSVTPHHEPRPYSGMIDQHVVPRRSSCPDSATSPTLSSSAADISNSRESR